MSSEHQVYEEIVYLRGFSLSPVWFVFFRSPIAAKRFFSCRFAISGDGRNFDFNIRWMASYESLNSDDNVLVSYSSGYYRHCLSTDRRMTL